MSLKTLGGPGDPTVRQSTNTLLHVQPASHLEILGIATATGCLAFILCTMFCVILRASWLEYCCGSRVTGSLHDTDSRPRRVSHKWANTLPRSQAYYHEEDLEGGYRDLEFAGSDPDGPKRTSGKELNPSCRRDYHTYGPSVYKDLSSRPWLRPDSPMGSTGRKRNIRSLDEAVTLLFDNAPVVGGPHNDSTHADEAILSTDFEANPRQEGRSYDSFLHHCTASMY